MSGTSILVYAERVGGNLGEIEKLLKGPLKDFDGIHVLPFFHPYDGDDAGFDPSITPSLILDWAPGQISSASLKLMS